MYPALRLLGHSRWLPGRFRALRALAPPDDVADLDFTVPFFGYRYSGNLRSYLDWNVYFLGAYSLNELELLRDLVRVRASMGKSGAFFDVGANVGNHALYMSRIVDEVVAFEPMPENLDRLRKHVADNAIGNIRVLDVALGAEAGTAHIAPDRASNPGGAHIVESGGVEIRVERGDDLMSGLPAVGVLKVDVEGYEANVLAGLRNTLLRDRPAILMELSGDDRSGFHDLAGLQGALYPNHRLYSVGWRRGTYGLAPFTMSAGEILVVPDELSEAVDRLA